MQPVGTEATLMSAVWSKNIQIIEPTSQDVICEVRLNLFIDIYLKLLQKRTSSNIAKSTFGTQMGHLSLWIPQETRLTWLSIPQWRTYNNSTVIGFRTHSPQRRELHSPCTCSIVSCDAFCRFEISLEKTWCATFNRVWFQTAADFMACQSHCRLRLMSWCLCHCGGYDLHMSTQGNFVYPLSYLIPLS